MRRLQSMSLLWKIMLSTSVAITCLLAVAGWLVQNHFMRNATVMLNEEVAASSRAYESLWRARAERLASVSLVLSRMSDVRAAFGTRDQTTIRDTASDLWNSIAPSRTLFYVLEPGGAVIASLGPAVETPPGFPLAAVSARFPGQATGFVIENGRLYQTVVTPVYVAAAHGSALLNVLVACFEVDAALARELKQATGSDFVFFSRGRLIASTLPVSVPAELTRHEQVRIGHLNYAQFVMPLADIAGGEVGELRILRSFQAADQRLATLRVQMVLIWMLAISLGLGGTYLLARRIVRPVRALEQAASRIATGDYDAHVPVSGSDELGRLAESFNEMCTSLRLARQELIRQERISTVGRLSTSIIHDLRNPLAAIYGGAEMLVDAELSGDQVKKLAASIYGSSRQILAMLQELADVSRGHSRRREACHLRDVVLAACDSLADAASRPGVSLACDVSPEIELTLDRPSVERVFQNLIANAIDALPQGGHVRISAEPADHSVVVSVEDDGAGISSEVRPHLFEPFATAGKRHGMGLGLALSRRTILDHGGEIWADSTTGRGARFLIRLPA
ncbi:MAG: ATP-binding protein [Bryobacteraceae bacterium]